MQLAIALLFVSVVIILCGLWIRRRLQDVADSRRTSEMLAAIQSQLNANASEDAQSREALRRSLADGLQALTGQVFKAMGDTSQNVGARLDSASQIMSDLRERLGKLDESSRQIVELGKDISSLQTLLQPPKLRGALGELFLGELLSQVLPNDHFKLQHRFKGGETVDAVIMLRAGLVPIDSKFPLDNLRRCIDACDEDSRKTAKKTFIKDVKNHIDAIASKYIRMDEGTFDFALIYIPAENVYYETIVKDDEFGGEMSIFNYALKKRVIPVSPHSFYAYLQTIALGLKGMRIEESAREVLENLGRITKEFDSFSESFRVVGQHLENSMKRYEEASRRFGKIESKIEQIDSIVRGSGQTILPAKESKLLGA